jgi:hypothetical protein
MRHKAQTVSRWVVEYSFSTENDPHCGKYVANARREENKILYKLHSANLC